MTNVMLFKEPVEEFPKDIYFILTYDLKKKKSINALLL